MWKRKVLQDLIEMEAGAPTCGFQSLPNPMYKRYMGPLDWMYNLGDGGRVWMLLFIIEAEGGINRA